MKKTILTAAILSAFLISCNDNKPKNETTEMVEATEAVHEHHGEELAAETHELNNSWINEINLDNSKKWDANIETTEGVEKMLKLFKSSDPKTVEDYHALASKLNEEKNVLVKKCTMEGPSHDNLHVFLHPLIEKIEALGKVSTVEEGWKVSESVKENLKLYYNYFN